MEGRFYAERDVIGEIDWNGVANHLVAVVHVIVDELEIVWEALYAGDLTHGHSSVEGLAARNEHMEIGAYAEHLWGLGVQLALTPTGLDSEARLVPTSYPIARHEDRRKRADVILMVWHLASVAISTVLV